jgi:hypothetical protein
MIDRDLIHYENIKTGYDYFYTCTHCKSRDRVDKYYAYRALCRKCNDEYKSKKLTERLKVRDAISKNVPIDELEKVYRTANMRIDNLKMFYGLTDL